MKPHSRADCPKGGCKDCVVGKSAFGVCHAEDISKADYQTRQANDAARAAKQGMVKPSGAPAKGVARVEDTRAATRMRRVKLFTSAAKAVS